jgi:hypothetical protein
VLRVCEATKTCLVAVTPWVGQSATIAEPALRSILVQHRGFYRGEPAIAWYEGSPPSSFAFLGVIPPTAEELALDPRGAFGGPWHESMVKPAFAELGLSRATTKTGPETTERLTEKRPDHEPCMSDDVFWMLIDRLNWESSTEGGTLEPMVQSLSLMSPNDIVGFQTQLMRKLLALDREELAREIGLGAYGTAHFSADHFLDVRCAVVARGRHHYEAVLRNPKSMSAGTELEGLLTAAETAYARKTGTYPMPSIGGSPETLRNRDGWPSKSQSEEAEN